MDSTMSLNCSICCESFNGNGEGSSEEKKDLVALKFCAHVFHKTCIDQCLKLFDKCPICRTSLSADHVKYYSLNFYYSPSIVITNMIQQIDDLKTSNDENAANFNMIRLHRNVKQRRIEELKGDLLKRDEEINRLKLNLALVRKDFQDYKDKVEDNVEQ